MNSFKKVILILVFSLSGSYLMAQPGEPGDPDVPITGIEILLAAGGLFGAKKVIDSKRKK